MPFATGLDDERRPGGFHTTPILVLTWHAGREDFGASWALVTEEGKRASATPPELAVVTGDRPRIAPS
jgi:hypothetical protein